MRKLFYLIACLSLTGLLGACNDDKENGDGGELSFKFPLTEYESAKIGGKKVIGFSTVGDWTAEVKYKVALQPRTTNGWRFLRKAGMRAIGS